MEHIPCSEYHIKDCKSLVLAVHRSSIEDYCHAYIAYLNGSKYASSQNWQVPPMQAMCETHLFFIDWLGPERAQALAMKLRQDVDAQPLNKRGRRMKLYNF